jgi:endo-1,4-beta-xylanase
MILPPVHQITAQQPPLRDLAGKAGVLVGAAVGCTPLTTDPQYAQVLAREYNILTPENEMKWKNSNPKEGVYDWRPADTIVKFALDHGMKVRGHNLVWHENFPEWITEGHFNRVRLIDIMENHIKAEAGHFRGKVYCWDVVNEAMGDDGKLRDTFFLRGIGPDYIEMAFRAAHEADPGAKLIYNDYGAEALGAKSDAVYQLVKNLKEKGVPIDGVGMQMHIGEEGIDFAGMKQNVERLRGLGVEVSVTELDVRLKNPVDAAKLDAQAKVYRKVCETLLSAQPHAVLVTWGFTDKSSWIPSFFHDFDAALPFDREFKPKPACYAIAEALGSEGGSSPSP